MATNRKKGLGRGLDVLLNPDIKLNTNDLVDENQELTEVDLSLLVVGKHQPRKQIDEDSLLDLANSIKQQGVIQPILVRQISKNKSKKYEIIAGERRSKAAKLAGLNSIPAIVKKIDDKTAAAVALIENIQRENLNAIEEAQAIHDLINEFNLTHEQLSKTIGKSRSSITNLLRLLQLPNSIQMMLKAGDIDMGHARALLVLNEQQQSDLAEKIIDKKLSVRETENQVKKILNNKSISIKNTEQKQTITNLTTIENKLKKYFNLPTKVLLNKKTKKTLAKVVVEIKTKEDLNQLIAKLKA